MTTKKKRSIKSKATEKRIRKPDGVDGRVKILTAHGKTMTRAEWSRHLGVKVTTISQRLLRHPPEVALSPDFRKIVFGELKARGFWNNKRVPRSEKTLESYRRNARMAAKAAAAKARRYTAHGETHSVTEWAAILGVNRHTLAVRLQRHPPEVALTAGDLLYLAGIPRSGRPTGNARRR